MEKQVVAVDHGDVRTVSQRPFNSFFDDVGDRRRTHAPGILAFGTQLLGNRGDAVVGRERRNPLIASDQRVQTLEQRRERPIEVEIEILNLLAARSERMADEIGA